MRIFLLVLAAFLCLSSSISPVLAQNCSPTLRICRAGAERPTNKEPVHGWFAETREGDFEIGLDSIVKHSGTNSAFVKSLVPHPDYFGNLSNWFVADDFRGKRLKMSAWVKTQLSSGTSQLWLRIDGDWDSGAKAGCFDNMDDRPIRGASDWRQYSLVVDVPEKSTTIMFGLMLIGTGQIWLDDVSFAAVGKDVPLTGSYAAATAESKRQKPVNLNFEEAQ